MREKSWNCVKMSTNLYISTTTYLPVKRKQHKLIREVYIRRCYAGAEKFHGLVKKIPKSFSIKFEKKYDILFHKIDQLSNNLHIQ